MYVYYRTLWLCQCIPVSPGSTYSFCMFCIVSSLPLELSSCSLRINHANCCPFLIRVPPVASTGGQPGNCPSLVRVLPITGMGKLPFSSWGPPNNWYRKTPGKMPFWSRGPPNNGYGRTPGKMPFRSPNNGYGRTPGKMPLSFEGSSNT